MQYLQVALKSKLQSDDFNSSLPLVQEPVRIKMTYFLN